MKLQNMLRSPAGWLPTSGSAVLSSRVRLARNIAGVPFPHQAGMKALNELLGRIVEAARGTGPFRKSALIKLEDIEPVDRAFLVERHLISRPLAAQPQARGVLVGEREVLSLMVNEEDHLRLQAMGPGLKASSLWEGMDALDDDLGRRLPFAFNERLGYLTAHPSNLGTGLRASCLLHLPALGLRGKINQVLEALPKMGATARGMFGEGTRVLGDLYQVSNAYSLGRPEAELIRGLDKVVGAVEAAETQARKALFAGSGRLAAEDRVHRSLGLLTHARLLSYEEAVQYLSYIRMGLAAGLDLRPALPAAVDELIFQARPAHLQMFAQRLLDPSERDAFRAEHLRRRLGAGSA